MSKAQKPAWNECAGLLMTETNTVDVFGLRKQAATLAVDIAN